jgi:hypothetical protein
LQVRRATFRRIPYTPSKCAADIILAHRSTKLSPNPLPLWSPQHIIVVAHVTVNYRLIPLRHPPMYHEQRLKRKMMAMGISKGRQRADRFSTQNRQGADIGHQRNATTRARPADGAAGATNITIPDRGSPAEIIAPTMNTTLSEVLVHGIHHHRDSDSGPYRDEDVLLSLQLLAYLSKYPMFERRSTSQR